MPGGQRGVSRESGWPARCATAPPPAIVNGGVKVGRVGGGLLSIGDQIVYRPPSFIGLQPTTWMVRRMYKVDVYLRVRRAVMVEGMSIRETARTFGLHRDTVRKMLAYSVPPGYRRQSPPGKPKLKPFTGVIDRILEDDLARPRKQRHTARNGSPERCWTGLPTTSTSWR